MPVDPTLDEKIAAVRRRVEHLDAIDRFGVKHITSAGGQLDDIVVAEELAMFRAVLADLEASRPTPGPDDPKDAKRLAEIRKRSPEAWDAVRITEQLSIARLDRVALLRLLDAATRRAEALEAALTKIASLEITGGAAANLAGGALGWPTPDAAPPAADHTELARENAWCIYFDDKDQQPEIFTGYGAEAAAKERYRQLLTAWSCYLFVEHAALTAAERAGAENMREQAKQALNGCDGPLFDWIKHCYVRPRDVISALPLPGEE